MTDNREGVFSAAAQMICARLVNIAVGMITIPFLIHYLTGTGFASWALLLALAAGFSLLDLGMPQAVVRFLPAATEGGNWEEAGAILGRIWIVLVAGFGAGLVIVSWLSAPLATWLRLPDTLLLSGSNAICLVFASVALKAFLQTGTNTLYAARRFTVVALISIVQPLLSNLAACVAAWRFGRLDLALISFWTAQLCVLGAVFVLHRAMCMPRFGAASQSLPTLRSLCSYGVMSQSNQWAQFVNFQFDKFLIAGLVGLWAVAPYEVANRCVQALRSIPVSGVETALPGAVIRQADARDSLHWYLATTRVTVYAVCIFMLGPLTVAPVFLYAWTGEMGYTGRWLFFALICGAMTSALALPAAILAQAAGRPGLPAGAAAVSILFNVALSLLLVLKWGLVGAAVGTALAMALGAAILARSVHIHFGWRLVVTLRLVASFWPLFAVCASWGVLTYVLFSGWFATLDPGSRYARATRAWPVFVAMLVYAMCLGSMLAVELGRGRLTLKERSILRRLTRFGRFHSQPAGSGKE